MLTINEAGHGKVCEEHKSLLLHFLAFMKQLLPFPRLPTWCTILQPAENHRKNGPYPELSKMVNSNNPPFHISYAITLIESWLPQKFWKGEECYPIIQMDWWTFVTDPFLRWYHYDLPIHCCWFICAATMEKINNEIRWNCSVYLIVLSTGFQLKYNTEFIQWWTIMVLMKDNQGLRFSSESQHGVQLLSTWVSLINGYLKSTWCA